MLPMRRPLYGNYSALRRHSRNLMRQPTTLQKFILVCGTFLILSTLFIAYQLSSCGPCPNCPTRTLSHGTPRTHIDSLPPINIPLPQSDMAGTNDNIRDGVEKEPDQSSWSPHKMALIVPFRNRFEELLEFVPHMHSFLNLQRVRHQIFIINQADSYRFNRASLINIGFLESSSECDYICMHDVDLLPLNPDLNYSYPDLGPLHLAAPELHPRYHYKTFVGGILLLKKEHFRLVNGLSNRYWGWGLEDDEFYVRIKQADLQISRPVGIMSTHLDTFKHVHDRVKHPRDGRRFGNQKKASRKRDYITGLNTVQYKLVSSQLIQIDHCPTTVINVELECDLIETPWCKEPESQRLQHPSGQIVAPLGGGGGR